MRILFVTAGYLPEAVGGVELHVAGLARALTAQGHDCAVLARTARPDVGHLALAHDDVDGIPVTRLGNDFRDCTEWRQLYEHEGIADLVLQQARAFRADVVHVHHLTCLSTRLVDKLRDARIPVVMTLHDFWMGCPRGQRITAGLDTCPEIKLSKCLPCLRELYPHLLGRGRVPQLAAEERDAGDLALLEEYHATIHRVLGELDALVVPSRFMRRMYAAYGVDPARITVVENGLPTARWAAARATGRLGALAARGRRSALRIGFIGSVLPSKGVHLLLEAFRRLGDPLGLRLDVWGEVLPFHNDRGYGERLAALRRGFESSIALHGRYRNEELPDILARLDVVVVPSIWYEAFALTIREAFLAGVPVVASNHGAMAEAVEDCVTGLLFEAGDAASLAAVLRRLADDPELRRRLAGSCPRVRDESDAASELARLYDRVRAARASEEDSRR